MTAERAYERLLERVRELSLLSSCATLLGWDEETYMPPGGLEHRAKQIGLLAGIRHHKWADPTIGDLVSEVAQSRLVDNPSIAINVHEAKRLHRRHIRMPRSLVEELAEATTIGQHQWAIAYAMREPEILEPWLEKILVLERSQAHAIGHEAGGEIYDALLDEYEPGAKTSSIAELMYGLARGIEPLYDRIRGSNVRVDDSALRGVFPVDKQSVFVREVASAVGFDFVHGRLDTSPHPFTAHVGPGDCRLTTRFEGDNLSEGFFATLHEVGHGLYDQGIEDEYWGTPVGDAPSLGLHESQSRLWENFVGRSLGFWRFFFPKAQELFATLAASDLYSFHAAVNGVAASASRARADLVTYDLHILIRFELERAMIGGDLSVAELPGAWDDAYHEHFGLRPKNPSEGFLQDGHWASGMFGYFPTYTLGNLIAAQLYQGAERSLGDLEALFAAGRFAPLLEWLRENVHRSISRTPELLLAATGRPLSHQAFVDEVTRRVTPLYGL